MTPDADEALVDPLRPPAGRGVYCNRTLNLRSIAAIGYDMDYTLVHYRVDEWERRVYQSARLRLAERGWPVADLRFDPELIIRGLAIDGEHGNVVKANRFGYVKRAFHGTRPLEFDAQRKLYERTVVDLAGDRFVFLNTLFELSEGCLYAQLVDLLDAGRLGAGLGYADLYRQVRAAVDATHLEGQLKAEIAAAPAAFVVPDPELPRALLDQRQAGKRLLLITNSEWSYTNAILTFALEPHLPGGGTWRSLFDVILVGARKPAFFSERAALFELADEGGLFRPCARLREGGVFLGGGAAHVEERLALSGDQILYVGDHLFSDVHVSKSFLRWRTALVLRELEEEIAAVRAFRPRERALEALMADKAAREYRLSHLRLALQRELAAGARGADVAPRRAAIDAVRAGLVALDERIAPLAREAGQLGNRRWGLLLRAGNDKSLLARQVERHADVYTSRASNLLFQTPFAFLRSVRGVLPHDVETD